MAKGESISKATMMNDETAPDKRRTEADYYRERCRNLVERVFELEDQLTKTWHPVDGRIDAIATKGGRVSIHMNIIIVDGKAIGELPPTYAVCYRAEGADRA